MERDQLITLLWQPDDATTACRAALHHGAPFTITVDPLPASHYATVYRRRARHIAQRGIPSLGFAEGVQRLEAAGDDPINLGWVSVATPPYHFQLFIASELNAIVACIGVDQAHNTRSQSLT